MRQPGCGGATRCRLPHSTCTDSGTDGADHMKYRKLLDPLFAPKRVAALEDSFREFAAELIDSFRAEVGELAGYSRGLATHHFGSKAGLLTAAVVDCTLYRCIQTPDAARAYLMLALEPTARWAAVRVRKLTAALRKQAEDAGARSHCPRRTFASARTSRDCEPILIYVTRLCLRVAADPSADLSAAPAGCRPSGRKQPLGVDLGQEPFDGHRRMGCASRAED